MKTIRQTGSKAASAAGSVLASKGSTKAEKSAAGSALSQVQALKSATVRFTSAAAASAAGSVLASKSSAKAGKSAAASALSRARNKKVLQVVCRVPQHHRQEERLGLDRQIADAAAA